jgi:Tfp pilus assembly ATPase PilU
MSSHSALPPWLLTAVEQAGDATVILKPGDRPFVIKSKAPYHLGTQPMTTLTLEGLAQQILSDDAQQALLKGESVEETLQGDQLSVTVSAVRLDRDIVIKLRNAVTNPPEVDEIAQAIEEETRIIRLRTAAPVAAPAPAAPAPEPVPAPGSEVEISLDDVDANTVKPPAVAEAPPADPVEAYHTTAEVDTMIASLLPPPAAPAPRASFVVQNAGGEAVADIEKPAEASASQPTRTTPFARLSRFFKSSAPASDPDETVRREQEEAARREQEEAARREQEEAARRAKDEAARREQEEAARRAAEEAARREQEDAARRAQEEAVRLEQEEAAQRAREAARREQEEAAQRAREAARREQEDAARRAREEAAHREQEDAARRAQEETTRLEQEEAARREQEEARRAQEEAAQREREDAARRAEEEAARREQEDAARRALEEGARREREDAARRAEEEAARREQEEAARRALEEAAQREREDAARRAQEDAARREQEEAARRAQEEAARREQEEAAQRAREDAAREALEKTIRRERDEAARQALEAALRREQEEAARRALEQVAQRAREEAARREQEEADRRAQEQAAQRELERVARRIKDEAARRALNDAPRRRVETAADGDLAAAEPPRGTVVELSRRGPLAVATTELTDWIIEALNQGATALYLRAGKAPFARIDGHVDILAVEPIPFSMFERAGAMLSAGEDGWERAGEWAWSKHIPGTGSVHCQAFSDAQGGGFIVQLPVSVVGLDEQVPRHIRNACETGEGLVVVSAPFAEDVAAMVGAVVAWNAHRRAGHIISFGTNGSLERVAGNAFISDRPLPASDHAMTTALQAALRERPDMLVTIASGPLPAVPALVSAAVGRLVIVGLVARTAPRALEALLDELGPNRHLLAATFKAACSWRGVRTAAGRRLVISDTLVATDRVSALIEAGDITGLHLAQVNRDEGMRGVDAALAAAVARKKITLREAAARAVDRKSLISLVRRQAHERRAAERNEQGAQQRASVLRTMHGA